MRIETTTRGNDLLPKYPKSRAGAVRQIDILIRRYRRDYAGGGHFGFDLPTMNANEP